MHFYLIILMSFNLITLLCIVLIHRNRSQLIYIRIELYVCTHALDLLIDFCGPFFLHIMVWTKLCRYHTYIIVVDVEVEIFKFLTAVPNSHLNC